MGINMLGVLTGRSSDSTDQREGGRMGKGTGYLWRMTIEIAAVRFTRSDEV
jgi:hypothetical protein